MNAQTIRAILHQRPFRGIEIRTTSGAVYDVHHPEMAAVLRTGLVVVAERDGSVAWFEAGDVADVRRKGMKRNGGPHRGQ